ncbi:MAG TPA: response regulator transcription factor [Thermomicrobiales bacterium]|nr:response regulator transcription factor [Thermomicrobiales bacterium]
MDDHALIRTALAALFKEVIGYECVGTASAEEAIAALSRRDFDAVLLDVCMPGENGLSLLPRIRSLRPQLPIVMLTGLAEQSSIRNALDHGAAGYLLKDADVSQIVESIETAIAGRGVYLHPMAAEIMFRRPPDIPSETLTARERDVLLLIAEGATNDEIAASLFITEKTVKTHLSGVFRKLDVTNRTQAATKALRSGILRTTEPFGA